MTPFLAFLACGSPDAADSGDTGTFTSWTPESPPSAIAGELVVLRRGPEDYREDWRYELQTVGPGECAMEGCTWAVVIEGNVDYDTGQGWQGDACDYEADAHYIPAMYPEPVFGFTNNNCDIRLEQDLVAVLWTSALEATLGNVEPGTEFGCFDDSLADTCEISGWIEVTP